MYKLILVDDEAEMRHGLQEVISFSELGFTVAGEAGDGMEALRLCEKLEPDLIITDIRMPLMDGLTLCRKAKAILPMVQCIILSGYDDFEFAKQAIDLKAINYLLKPISSAEFSDMLANAKATLDEEFDRRRNITLLKERFVQNLPILRESLFTSLLNGGMPPAAAQERSAALNMNLSADQYVLALYQTPEDQTGSGIEDKELRNVAIANVLREVFAAHALRAEVFPHDGMIAALFMRRDSSEEGFAQLVACIDEARKTARHYLNCQLYVGVSDSCGLLSQLPAANREATGALYQCMLSQEEQVMCSTDLRHRPSDDLQVDALEMAALSNGIKVRDLDGARQALDHLMDAARGVRPSPRAWQTYLMEIVLCCLRIISEHSLAWEGLDEQLESLTRSILSQCPSVDAASESLSALLEPMVGALDEHRQTSSRVLASAAESYLRENYTREDTSLEQLCLHLHISPSYFSTVFKKETKKTFHQYLTELRMDKALNLLSTTDQKISQVAQSVGLPDQNYFSYCFRKHFGYPPSRARSR